MQLTIEVHIINFKADVYNQNLTLYFKQRIRNEMKFDNIKHLKHQLTQDKLKVTQIFGVQS
jgi:riboflavin kinase/FMN adenylyltransferase